MAVAAEFPITHPAFEDGFKDRQQGLHESPNRHGWASRMAYKAYYKGYDWGHRTLLVQGWLFR